MRKQNWKIQRNDNKIYVDKSFLLQNICELHVMEVGVSWTFLIQLLFSESSLLLLVSPDPVLRILHPRQRIPAAPVLPTTSLSAEISGNDNLFHYWNFRSYLRLGL